MIQLWLHLQTQGDFKLQELLCPNLSNRPISNWIVLTRVDLHLVWLKYLLGCKANINLTKTAIFNN